MTRLLLSTLLFFTLHITQAQKGKDGTLTQSGTTIVNEFTTLTSDAIGSNTTINVASSSLNTNGRFTGNLAPGDLILIIQIQGTAINGSPEPWTPGTYGLPNDASWGQITNYNNCGNNEYAEVKSIPNGTSIELRCGLTNNYTSLGKVQIVRVPRYENLTVNGTLTTEAWNGNFGGILAIEVNNNLIINGTITASGLGFRGAAPTTGVSELGVSHFSRPDADAGGLKGEGISGWGTEYDIYGGRYAMGSPANGGGGGTAHNGGGGGGGNAGNTANWNNGVGVPDAAYNTAWALETPSISGVSSSGGGRGGYTFSGANRNANSAPPGDASWGGDNRQNRGGLGGRPLDYSTGRIFLGGGGGAGDLNESSSIGGGGGNGGGIVYILNYGNVSGTGNVISNGAIGEDVTAPNPGFLNIAGNDGAGGGGAGGTIIINSNGTISGISINANGGIGGDQIIVDGGFGDTNEAEGPGGGGGGGYIAISNGTITKSTNGGVNGTTNSAGVTEFPPNGATSGGTGLPNETISNYFLTTTNDTICSGTTSTLTATVNGTLPGGATITWYDAEVNGNIIGTNTFTTPPLSTNTTYYVGTCPGNYLVPVSVIISPPLTFNDASIVINNENCGLSDGTITGITISGGTAPLTYAWNGVPTISQDLSNVSAGNYTLIVTDNKGCSTTIGTYSIGNASSLALNTTSISITDENCGMGNGGITGITTSGGTAPYTYTWNGATSMNADTTTTSANNYTLIVTDALGCFVTSATYTIANIPGPILDTTGYIIGNESCTQADGSITGITVSGGTAPISYSWNGTITTSIDTINLAAGDYSLIITDATGCTSQTGIYSIIDNTAPLLDTSGVVITNETCGNTNGSITGITTIGGNAPFSYSWNGNITSTIDTTGIAGDGYTLTITDAYGCTVTSNLITVSNLGLIVDTNSVVITNDACTQGSGSIIGVTVSGGTQPYTYTWNGAVSTTADTLSLFAGVYQLTITDAASCSFTTNSYTINDNSGPTINLSNIVITPETCGLANGEITGITASGGLLPFIYSWNGGTTSTADTIGVTGGSYILTVTDGNNCFSTTVPITVDSFNGPSIDTSAINIVHEDCYAGNGSISGIVIQNGTAPFTYAWNGTSGNLDTANLSNGGYILSVTDNNGCPASLGAIVINNSGAPVADFTLSSNSIPLGDVLSLTNTSSLNATSFSWDFNNGNTSTEINPSTTYTGAGAYSICLIASTVTNCPDTICKTVTVTEETESVIGIPLAFSPNNDTHNDVLYVRGSGITSLTFSIYNRYGEKVFETNDTTVGWDGTYKGQDENTGVFVYYIEYEFIDGTKESLKGNVTLVR